ncbi:MAG: GNAT family N-acetyltransferase [Armatimonadetes bacterium]|nr:GNAT family N-acetyltransferase [Armatimonadota bacterium]MDE2205022.1 GNAT family N-acetyltransferase [Armatimonadota bacterium]
MDLEPALEVAARGFAELRSVTHPYLVDRVRGVLRLHDAPRKGYMRCEEYFATCKTALELDGIAREYSEAHYRLCLAHGPEESDAGIRSDFRNLKYRLRGTEAVFAHGLTRIEPAEGPLPILRVTTPELEAAQRKAAGSRMMRPEYITDGPAPVRMWAAFDGDMPVGWVLSVEAAGAASCLSMFVQEAYRRRGIARALLGRMLAFDRDAGAVANVLLASREGAKLYPTVGYRHLGDLMVYTPPRG